MSSVTQIMNLTLKDGISVEDARAQQTAAITDHLQKSPGVQSVSWGSQLEDSKKTTLFITYDSISTLQSHTSSAAYPTFISSLQSYSTFGENLRVTFSPLGSTNSSAPRIFASSPLLFFHTVYLKPDTDKETWMKNLHDKARELAPKEGEHGWKGIVVGEVDGEQGQKLVTAYGWDRKEDYEKIYATVGGDTGEVMKELGAGVEMEKGVMTVVDMKNGSMAV